MAAAVKPQAMKDAFLLPIEQIKPSPLNPRKTFDQGELLELALSIREHGVLEPLLVRKVSEGYELIAGERRLRAAEIAKVDKLPVRVIQMDDDAAVAELRLIENLQRKDLPPLEEAKAIQDVILKYGLSQETVSKRLGKSEQWVRTRLRLCTIPESMQNLIAEGKVPLGCINDLAPLVDYPVFKAVSGRIGEMIEGNDSRPVTAKEVSRMVEDILSHQYMQRDYLDEGQDEEAFLAVDITDYNLDIIDADHLCPHFDWEKCKECKDTWREVDDDTKEENSVICLLPECFNKKLEEANIKFRQFQAEEAERLGAKPSDPDQKLLGVEYEFIELYGWNTFDKCAGCVNKVEDAAKKTTKCLDPKCHASLEKEKRAKELKQAKDAWGKFINAIDRKTLARLGGGVTSMTPPMKRRLIKVLWDDWQGKEACDKTMRLFGVNKTTTDKLEDDDLDVALTRILLFITAKDLSKSTIPTPENVEAALLPPPTAEDEGDTGPEAVPADQKVYENAEQNQEEAED